MPTPDPQNEQDAKEALPYLQKAFKSDAYQETIKKVSNDLNGHERHFSRVVHSPILEGPGSALSHTLMHPAGILGGGVVSLVGTIILVYMAHYRQVRYNFTAYFALFAVGFLGGITIYSLIKLKRR